MSPQYVHDPDATLDYQIDWEAWLAGDTLTRSTWNVPDGLTHVADTYTDTTTTIWLSGGVVDTEYTVTNQIETDAGRTDERSFIVKVVEQ